MSFSLSNIQYSKKNHAGGTTVQKISETVLKVLPNEPWLGLAKSQIATMPTMVSTAARIPLTHRYALYVMYVVIYASMRAFSGARNKREYALY
jgi:hypothetical protein